MVQQFNEQTKIKEQLHTTIINELITQVRQLDLLTPDVQKFNVPFDAAKFEDFLQNLHILEISQSPEIQDLSKQFQEIINFTRILMQIKPFQYVYNLLKITLDLNKKFSSAQIID